jgi:protein subunit release factor B
MPPPESVLRRLDALGVPVSDVDEKFVRGSGPGGQKINKTSSTVWLRHRPTGIEVRCQAERSQAANRDEAWRELCGKLEARVQADRASARQAWEKERRQTRQKSRRQKALMVQAKRHRARHKGQRGRVGEEG